MAGGLWQAIDTQRTALATLLAGLTAAQWAHRSLCAGWTVRDVTGHLLLPAHPAEMLWLARHAASCLDDAIRRSGIRLAGRYDTTELTAAIGGLCGTRRRFPYATARSALVDVVVHSLDIGVPLNRPVAPPPEVTAIAATEVGKHLPGLWPRPSRTLRATDVEWQQGEGPLLQAPIADLLLILTGRVTP
ncbi:maleylpyruvate isomerase family mycothiol-dependent enzyme [Actinoplanes sp. NPDC051411]|uniref:maleylpyruvate isomerase family mycothiol-dependent enzyme n=1 Tax=Actinoplanes sp. NPDC051411 TaxID=3155522 RepID=UPI003441B80E